MTHPICVNEIKLQRANKSGRKFLNPIPTNVGDLKTLMKIAVAFARNREERMPMVPPGPFHTALNAYATPSTSGLRVTWFGHSGMLLEVDGVTLLLDPMWDERASPVTFMGPRRFFAPTVALADLPPIDAVLISHDHYDHLGSTTVRTLAAARPGLRWITSLRVGAVLRGFGVAAGVITELDWTESASVTNPQTGATLNVTALPARHFSGRSLFNRFTTLWSSFVVRGPRHNLYCGADTGPWEGLRTIGQAYGPFDLTMLEIGAYSPFWGEIHLGPAGAADGFAMLGGGVLMPIHWGLFDLALHGWRQPMEQLTQLAAEKNLRLFSPKPGRPTELPAQGDLVDDWWRSS